MKRLHVPIDYPAKAFLFDMGKRIFYDESEIVFQEKSKNPNFIDAEGLRYGKLIVIGFAGFVGKEPTWFCRCECEKITKVYGSNLRAGTTKSCGCLSNKIFLGNQRITHGHCKRHNLTSIYRCWSGMIQRCQNPNYKRFSDYGGRGITVCERWLKFENFFADMGERQKGLTLERIENDGNYCPENCRWATPKEQANNRRNNIFLTFDGKTQPLSQWSETLGIKTNTILTRIRRGWSIEEALTPCFFIGGRKLVAK